MTHQQIRSATGFAAWVEQIAPLDNAVILCANNRLARNLRLAHGQHCMARGATLWPALAAVTVDAWLDRVGEQIVLSGEIPRDQIPNRVLSPFQECLLWKQVIDAAGAHAPELALFDLHGLARTAADAHALVNVWHLRLAGDGGAEETQRFIEWRKRFHAVCSKQGWLDALSYQQRILDWLHRGGGVLPQQVVFAGFDTLSPHLVRLQQVLTARGVELVSLDFSTTSVAQLRAVACADAEAECRAAVAWAQQLRQSQPAARIGIVVADLEARRALLLPILDEILEPARWVTPDDAPATAYNLSIGLPLGRYALVQTALALLRLLGARQGLPLAEMGELLRMPYWSADQTEADLRAQVDALLRERPAQVIGIDVVLRAVRRVDRDGASRLVQHLEAMQRVRDGMQRACRPSEWAALFREVLGKGRSGWPGQRTLSSAELQTREAFFAMLDTLAGLDVFLGSISMPAATGELARLCRERIFQPKTPGQPAVQVLGLLEAKGAVFDALWVMGMNDAYWPPPARPNPLLPADLQRRQGTPGACAEVQARFAHDIHQRLLHAAPAVSFSYALKEGERDLLPSPLIAELLPHAIAPAAVAVAAAFAHVAEDAVPLAVFEAVDDHLAPSLAAGEAVAGGSGLLKAQAICPAWAFYRYRLGAKKLETPSEGLDASARGTLVHDMLEVFWTDVGSTARLDELSPAQREEKLAMAVTAALARHEAIAGEPFSPTFRQLETERMCRLGREAFVLDGSGQRPAFRVVACEQEHTVELGQLHIRLVVDRIDELEADGRRVVLDYKTGRDLDIRSWFGDRRITEPQLPLYAALVLDKPDSPPLAAVAFARVRLRECQFAGVAADAGLLPKVARVPHPADIPAAVAWQALLGSWKTRLEILAEEIRQGEAAVCYEDERALAYCEVLPLLRLTERRLQFEKFQAAQR